MWIGILGLVVKISREGLAELGYDGKSGKIQNANSVDKTLFLIFRGLNEIVCVTDNITFKGIITSYSFLFMIFSREGKRIKPLPRLTPQNSEIVGTRTIYLLRHGESMWNYGVNRGLTSLIPRWLYLLWWEFRLLLTRDSVFIDSPLSELGVSQSLEAKKFIDNLDRNSSDYIALRCNDPQQSALLVSSNLRRAMSTVMIACNSRLSESASDSVHVNSDLQEMTRNIDGISLSQKRHNTPVSTRESCDHSLCAFPHPISLSMETLYNRKVNGAANKGNKTISSRFQVRLRNVCDWIFTASVCSSRPSVLLAGHSLFFRQLLKDTLPDNFEHDVKSGKISNGGIVRIEMLRLKQGDRFEYYVPAESMVVLCGKIEAKKKQKVKI